jgi:hypothetical protein
MVRNSSLALEKTALAYRFSRRTATRPSAFYASDIHNTNSFPGPSPDAKAAGTAAKVAAVRVLSRVIEEVDEN